MIKMQLFYFNINLLQSVLHSFLKTTLSIPKTPNDKIHLLQERVRISRNDTVISPILPRNRRKNILRGSRARGRVNIGQDPAMACRAMPAASTCHLFPLVSTSFFYCPSLLSLSFVSHEVAFVFDTLTAEPK